MAYEQPSPPSTVNPNDYTPRTTPAASSSGQIHRVLSATGGVQHPHVSNKKAVNVRDLTSMQLLAGGGWLARLAEVRSGREMLLVEGGAVGLVYLTCRCRFDRSRSLPHNKGRERHRCVLSNGCGRACAQTFGVVSVLPPCRRPVQHRVLA